MQGPAAQSCARQKEFKLAVRATSFGTAVASTQTGKTRFHRPILPWERRCPEKFLREWVGNTEVDDVHGNDDRGLDRDGRAR
jgi:hypothetical protein